MSIFSFTCITSSSIIIGLNTAWLLVLSHEHISITYCGLRVYVQWAIVTGMWLGLYQYWT